MRRVLRKALGIALFVLLIGTVGLGIAAVAGLFVIGDLSGALKPDAVESTASPKGLIPIRYAKQDLPAVETTVTNAVPASSPRIPPPLVAPTPEVVRVERAVPILPDVPVRRAEPVTLKAPTPRVFDARAALSDDESIPRARPVTSDRVKPLDRPYALPANRSVAQRDAVGLDW
jgi:hypothetical protein